MRIVSAFVAACLVAGVVVCTATAAGPLPSAGSLTVRSIPYGAAVYLDTERVGVTPLTIPDVSPGTHLLLISLPGYQDHATVVTVEPGKNAVYSANLRENQGRIDEIALGVPGLEQADGFCIDITLLGLCVFAAACRQLR